MFFSLVRGMFIINCSYNKLNQKFTVLLKPFYDFVFILVQATIARLKCPVVSYAVGRGTQSPRTQTFHFTGTYEKRHYNHPTRLVTGQRSLLTSLRRRFPANKQVRHKWLSFAEENGKRAVDVRTKSLICSVHFESNSFLMYHNQNIRFLKKTAVPSLNVVRVKHVSF